MGFSFNSSLWMPPVAVLHGGSGVSSTLTYTGTGVNSAGSTSSTFSSMNIGTASSERYVAIAIASRVNGTVNSVTVGGAACTAAVTAISSFARVAIHVTTSKFTSGTTADIVVVTSSAPTATVIAVYSIDGISSSTATDSTSTTTDNATMSLTIPARGHAIAIAHALSGSGTFTHSGTTEDLDTNYFSSYSATAGSLSSTPGESASIAIDYSSTGFYAAACAAFA